MEQWCIRKTYGVEKMWQSYLVSRALNETDPEVGRYMDIRQIAREYCQETEADYQSTVDSLCWLALEQGAAYPGHKEGWDGWSNRHVETSNVGLNLLSAAAYFDHLPLAKRLLSEGYCPTSDDLLFPSPMQLAAWAGNISMLKLFQEHLPEFEDIPPRHEDDKFDHWRGKTGPGSIKGAALRGDMDMIRLAIYPPSRSDPTSTDFSGQPHGHLDTEARPNINLWACVCESKTWEMFQYLDAFFKESHLVAAPAQVLRRYTELGNLEIVKQLLDAGVDIHGGGKLNRNPLTVAARFCHEDIVDLLLQRGADPNYTLGQQRGPPLGAAASAGSLSIVRKLLDHGAGLEETDSWPLRHAVRLEHTAMVELLIERNPIGCAKDKSEIIRMALKDGLESMAQLLEEKCPELPSQ